MAEIFQRALGIRLFLSIFDLQADIHVASPVGRSRFYVQA